MLISFEQAHNVIRSSEICDINEMEVEYFLHSIFDDKV